MQPDDAWLIDVLAAAKAAREHAEGLDEQRFMDSALHQDAVIRQLEIVGEAAGKLSDAARSRLSVIDWPRIVWMRNRLIHAYFEVDLDLVWTTVQEELPRLIDSIEDTMRPGDGGTCRRPRRTSRSRRRRVDPCSHGSGSDRCDR